jgi:hypothetical protein
MTATIGIDLDNTIVDYAGVFYTSAIRQGLVPSTISRDKTAIRNYLRVTGKEDAWTELQGSVYGPSMCDADLFPGVAEFFKTARGHAVTMYIISHRTRYPYKGLPHDLHQSAFEWLEKKGFFEPSGFALNKDHVLLCESTADKLRAIVQKQCTYFIDDLPEFLSDKNFPLTTKRFLFSPKQVPREIDKKISIARSWKELSNLVFAP